MTARIQADLLLHDADHVLLCDEEGARLTRASVAVGQGRILVVGPAEEISAAVEAEEVLDLRGHLVMPGLVNLHTHLPMTLLRGIAENVDLAGFLQLVWAEEARIMDEAGTLRGARLGALEALLGGTTTALDMYFHPEAAHRGAVEAGLRHIIGPVFFDSRGPDDLDWAERMELLERWSGILAGFGGPLVPNAVMPHSPQIVSPPHLAELARIADAQGAIVHTHCSETVGENAATFEAFGARPAALLAEAGLLRPGTVLGHGVHLSAEDLELVAASGTGVAHCPGSNLKLASGAADIVGYRALGIPVGIGTDGCSSSNDLDMFAAMRLAANVARLVRSDPAAISALEVLRAATLDGARALGLADRVGTVQAGKEADLAVLNLRAPHLTPVRDPYTAIVFSAGRSDVRHVLVAGELVVRDGASTRLDLAAVLDEALAHVDTSGT